MPHRIALYFGVLLIPSPLFAQDQTFTPHHVAKMRFVTAAVISPDGSQVAYVLGVPRQLPKEKDGTAWSELHVVDKSGTSTPFITGAVNVDSVAWTPDGKSLSFLAKRDKDEYRSLYVIPVRGGEARKALSHGADILSYSWSPNGKQIAFLATEPTPKDKKAQQDQGFSQEIYEEDNPFVRVWVSEPESSQAARKLKLEGSATELNWHPKEDWLAVALAPTPLVDDGLMFRKVNVVHLKTGQSFDLKNPGKMGQVAWSPDGKLLALISGVDKHDPSEGRLWIETEQMKGWTDVLPKFPGHVDEVAWKSPKEILYVASEGVWTTLGSVELRSENGSLSGTQARKIINGAGPILNSISASRDGKSLAFIGHTPRHPPEVYFMGAEDKEPRRLTDNNPWLRTMSFGEQEVVKYKARDGLELEGILFRPLGEKKGQRYPLVLTVHGGPEAHYSNGWLTTYSQLGHIGAARGMAVFYPNYRGSTGRGVEFSMKGQKEAAGKEFDDLVDAVDHLVKDGLVDTKKVGITGGSYGGYATAWGSTYYSHRFAAGVMFVGISNSVSKVGTTDIPWEMYLVHHRKWLWDDFDYFLKSSPIYHLEKANTPLLILHGKADPRVHPSQSLELYRNLKLRGKAPVRLVLYPGEGHGNRRAASRLDYNLRLQQWMEHYLKGPGGTPPAYELDYGLTPPPKTSATSASWNRTIDSARTETASEYVTHMPWLGRGCPCRIGP
ncbi:MAG: S9 family peptidase [Gemmataceae bacterium]|nr:S9 family peptidase [Gemmataceae bacterium]MCI0742743.1 S9 family peptidase [Gemmataceae bacterium]